MGRSLAGDCALGMRVTGFPRDSAFCVVGWRACGSARGERGAHAARVVVTRLRRENGRIAFHWGLSEPGKAKNHSYCSREESEWVRMLNVWQSDRDASVDGRCKVAVT